MKRQVILSVLAAVAIFAVSTTAEAGLFGRLHTIRGCAPCEPVCEQPCEPVACQPCEVVACDPCEPACDPCGTPCFDGCNKPFRPFGGFFMGLKAKLGAKLHNGCDPCEPVCEQPCEPVACDPCEPVCDPCGRGPFLPFNGLFLNLRAKLATHLTPCNVGCDVACDPCEPACASPCDSCN